MSDLFLVINTCKSYYKNIYDLIKQINNSNFNKENVLIVSAQEDENSVNYYQGIKIVKVKYTALHLSSVIYIRENIEQYSNINYWILLPDTIKFGKNFFTLIHLYYDIFLKNKEVFSLPFINYNIRPTMDMGIVHTKHLINMTNYLKNIKTYHTDIEALTKLKIQLIYDENIILGLPPSVGSKATKFDISESPQISYFISNKKDEICEKLIDNGKINEVYFKNLDLYKYQRNFKGPSVKLVLSL